MIDLIKRVHSSYWIAIGYVVLSLLLGFYLNDGLIVFLGWNMMLATFVFFLSQLLNHVHQTHKHPIIQILLFGIWVIFFPNSLYILTDFIHFQNYPFFERYMDIYNLDISNWLIFTHIVIGGLFAAKMGIDAIILLTPMAKKVVKSWFYPALFLLFLLSSTGIYIGRFLRLNSWNIFQLPSIIQSLFTEPWFMIQFISLFTILHGFIYFLFHKQAIQTYNKDSQQHLEAKE